MFGTLTPGADPQAAQRVAGFTRQRFGLPPEATVLVTELACALPGCPPRETVIAFWTGAEPDLRRHHYKVFKPLLQVVQDDLPPYWMREALAVAPDFACDCC